jgi:hypothetical protein
MSKTLEKTYRGLIKNTFRALTGKAKKYQKQGLKVLDNHFNSPYYKNKRVKKYKGASLICSSNLPLFNGENKNNDI